MTTGIKCWHGAVGCKWPASAAFSVVTVENSSFAAQGILTNYSYRMDSATAPDHRAAAAELADRHLFCLGSGCSSKSLAVVNLGVLWLGPTRCVDKLTRIAKSSPSVTFHACHHGIPVPTASLP